MLKSESKRFAHRSVCHLHFCRRGAGKSDRKTGQINEEMLKKKRTDAALMSNFI